MLYKKVNLPAQPETRNPKHIVRQRDEHECNGKLTQVGEIELKV